MGTEPDPVAVVEATLPDSEPIESWLCQEWERRRKAALGNIISINFSLVMAQGLSCLVEATECRLALNQSVPDYYGDVNLVFTPISSGGAIGSLGISLCDHNSYRLPPRLKRLRKQWDTARKNNYLGELVVIRPARLVCGPKGDELLDSFEAAPTCVVRIDDQQLTELAAMQQMFQKAHNGDLTQTGPPILVQQVSAWAAKNMPSSVRELLHAVFGD